MRIIKSTVDKLTYEKFGRAADYRWDDQLKGFGVRIYPSGRCAFVVTYRTETGTKKFLTLGNYGNLTVDEARRLAKDKLHDVQHGRDPQTERQEKRHEMTFDELADRYLDHYKGRKKSWKDDNQRLRDHLRPVLGKRKLSEISLMQLQRLQTKIKAKLSAATTNRCTALVKHIFNTAVKWGLLESSPARHLTMYREPPPRDIVLTPEVCRDLIDACNADENVYAAALFKLAMFTGRRIGELLNAKWADVDLDRAILTLPETKAGGRQFVYLNEIASAILRTMPRIEGNPYVIAGEATGKPLNFYRRAWKRILNRAGIDHFPPHGLRHNYASMLVAANVPLETVGHLLGHKNTSTTRKYAHHRPDHLRRAAETFSDVVDLHSEREKRADGKGPTS